MMSKYLGLMSGTSLDAVSIVILELPNFKLLHTHTYPIGFFLRKKCLSFTLNAQQICLPDLLETHVQFGKLFAAAVLDALRKYNLSATDIRAIGSHGQTIYHMPQGKHPYSLQIGDPNVIAYQTKINTIADFRNPDIAAGGQGAPLAPILHETLFRTVVENRLIINLGGIANISFLPSDFAKAVIGFDTGPANSLLDAWVEKHLNKKYDAEGQWAASGKVIPELLNQLLQHPYFQKSYPKSTGKEIFNLHWLESQLESLGDYKPEDVQATLALLSAKTLAQALKQLIQDFKLSKYNFYFCGGGVNNTDLISRISKELKSEVYTTAHLGLDPEWVEASLMALLAYKRIQSEKIDLRAITGSSEPILLGTPYSA
ncbi:MAG: anhydro-N-acetylmuramic acid kinase [Gammaproteobacteria bacterium]